MEKRPAARSDIEQNIAVFSAQLRRESDVEKRHILNELLAQEQERLHALDRRDPT